MRIASFKLLLIEHSVNRIKFWKICTAYIYRFDILFIFFFFSNFLFSNIKVIFQHLYSIRNWLLIEKILKSWAPITRKEYQLKSFLWHINQCRWKSRICLVVKWFSEWLSKKLWVFKSNSLKFCWCKNIYWGTKVYHFISFYLYWIACQHTCTLYRIIFPPCIFSLLHLQMVLLHLNFTPT